MRMQLAKFANAMRLKIISITCISSFVFEASEGPAKPLES